MLRAAGIGRGDRVAILADRSPALIWSMLAVLRLGAIESQRLGVGVSTPFQRSNRAPVDLCITSANNTLESPQTT